MIKFIIKIFSVFSMLFILACNEGPANPEDFSRQLVVDGYLYAGQPLDSLILRETQPVNQALNLSEGITGAEIQLISGDSTFILAERDDKPGYYYLPPDEFKAQAFKTYQIDITTADYNASASTTVPGPFSLISVSADTIRYAQQPLRIQWTESENAFGYVIVITSLDTTAGKIERRFADDDEEENEPERSGFGVIDETSSDLPWFGFNYYGRHRVDIYAADLNFYEFAKTARQSSATLEEPIFNIQGALGIFGSAQVLQLEVVVVSF